VSHSLNRYVHLQNLICRSLTNGDNSDESQTNILDEKSTLPDSSSLSDHIEDNPDDNRKIHHSDSLYLLRKKVQNDDDDTSDDESQLSSSIEPQQHIIHKV
jgi:hypothetical protein